MSNDEVPFQHPWDEGPIKDYANVIVGGTPRTEIEEFWGGDIPWMASGEVHLRHIHDVPGRITKRGLQASNAVLVQPQAVAIALAGQGKTRGTVALTHVTVCTNQSVALIKPMDGRLDAEFLYQSLIPRYEELRSRSAGGGRAGLSKGILEQMPIQVPPHTVQQRITSVLQTIDRTITQTEALIEKYQQIKAGLMHDLFTRGIGADGQLRPTRERSPELYWESAIGWLPKGWSFTTCSDVCEKVIDCKNRTPPITPDGYPVIRTPNVRNGLFVDDELVFTDYHSYLIWTARGKPEPEDIVITREAPVGEVCKIPKRHQSACLGQRMMLYRTDSAKIINDYFLYVLQSQALQNRLDLISGGSTVGHVRVGDIRSLWIFYPESKIEQLKIAETLNRISGRMESEINQLNKLKMQKSGLMHDLLTGKVPVTIEEAT